MEINIRTTHAFADLKVDEIETTIFYSSKKEMKDTILNLLSVADQLCEKGGFHINDLMSEI